jgi:hypothetical protein
MTINHINSTTQPAGQINPLKTLEIFYGLMMPIWAVTSSAFENQKKLHEELVEMMLGANEQATDGVVNAIEHNQPKDLFSAMAINSKALGQANLTAYNANLEQCKLFIDAWFQLIEKTHAQLSKETRAA